MADDGWEASAEAWIASQGERGDFGREHVLDPVMLERVVLEPVPRALDVGSGEGRFCRLLRAKGIDAVGVEPTATLRDEALRRDPGGDYRDGRGEALDFADDSFDLVVSYLTLIDMADFRTAFAEMTRVLVPGGRLLIANLNGFVTAKPHGWYRDTDGRRLHYPVDDYSTERADWVEWSGIRIRNWHRPLSAYMKALVELGMTLTFFDEPLPRSGDAEMQARYARVPWFHVMEWRKSG
jgi:SAM-dependent methyltransferase